MPARIGLHRLRSAVPGTAVAAAVAAATVPAVDASSRGLPRPAPGPAAGRAARRREQLHLRPPRVAGTPAQPAARHVVRARHLRGAELRRRCRRLVARRGADQEGEGRAHCWRVGRAGGGPLRRHVQGARPRPGPAAHVQGARVQQLPRHLLRRCDRGPRHRLPAMRLLQQPPQPDDGALRSGRQPRADGRGDQLDDHHGRGGRGRVRRRPRHR